MNKLIPKIKEKLENYQRVFQIARKPDKEEIVRVSKICAIGIAFVGFIGFLIYLIAILFLGG